jgi:hypothetical protein
MKTLNELGLMSETGTLEDRQFIVDESQLAVELHGFYTVAELEAAIADLKAINQAFAYKNKVHTIRGQVDEDTPKRFRVIAHYDEFSEIDGIFDSIEEAEQRIKFLEDEEAANYCSSNLQTVIANENGNFDEVIDSIKYDY